VVLDYYPQKIAAIRYQIVKYRQYEENLQRQQQVTEMQHVIAR
jgi:hypothetical protein